MKLQRLFTVFLLSIMVTLLSCGNETVTQPTVRPNPGPQPTPGTAGLIGTYSSTVQNTDHTKSGTLTISITEYLSTGVLVGTLTLTGFSDCFTTGIFPDPSGKYENEYLNGFGKIMAIGPEPDSHSFLYFLPGDFSQGLQLWDIDGLGFYDGRTWCLEIDPILLKRE